MKSDNAVQGINNAKSEQFGPIDNGLQMDGKVEAVEAKQPSIDKITGLNQDELDLNIIKQLLSSTEQIKAMGAIFDVQNAQQRLQALVHEVGGQKSASAIGGQRSASGIVSVNNTGTGAATISRASPENQLSSEEQNENKPETQTNTDKSGNENGDSRNGQSGSGGSIPKEKDGLSTPINEGLGIVKLQEFIDNYKLPQSKPQQIREGSNIAEIFSGNVTNIDAR